MGFFKRLLFGDNQPTAPAPTAGGDSLADYTNLTVPDRSQYTAVSNMLGYVRDDTDKRGTSGGVDISRSPEKPRGVSPTGSPELAVGPSASNRGGTPVTDGRVRGTVMPSASQSGRPGGGTTGPKDRE